MSPTQYGKRCTTRLHHSYSRLFGFVSRLSRHQRPHAHRRSQYPVGRITVPHFDAASPTATLTAEYFGWRIPLVIPPVSLAAILLLGIRLDARPPEVPTFISTSREPVHGFPPPLGPTKQDVLEVRARAAERLARAGTFSGSELDAAWWRSVRLSQNLPHPYSAYRVGTLTGAWAGTIMVGLQHTTDAHNALKERICRRLASPSIPR
jgi:hypothetical protein